MGTHPRKSVVVYLSWITMAFIWNQGISSAQAACYIGVDFQGEFLTQVTTEAQGTQYAPALPQEKATLAYSRIAIQSDAIPIWGTCHKKMGANIVLRESSDDGDCFRCFLLQYRSPNVIHIFTQSLSTCFVHESLAIQSCPSETQIRIKAVHEMILYRSEDEVVDVFCPFRHGHYQFSYVRQTENPFASDRCSRATAMARNCPTASDLELQFQSCSFPEKVVHFKCLGDWIANETGERFVALLETSAEEGDEERTSPKYRCGIFHEDELTGRAALTLSSDSTCQANLYSASMGYESLLLKARPERPWPAVVRKGSCSFPDWSQGTWKDLEIDGSTMRHRSQMALETFSSHCIQESSKHPNRFLIYSRTSCGKSQYNCIWFEPRGVNILEYQLGLRPSTIPSSDLCDNDHFLQRTWRTQAKKDFLMLSSCPIAGDYNGILPDNPNFCAKLSSDCNNPDVMFYSVSSCDTQHQILEDREYQCLGQWEEDGLLFTYTKRRDVPGYECFIGSVDPTGGIYLIEGGVDCRRGLRVAAFGMKLTQRSNCYGFPVINHGASHPQGMLEGNSTTPWYKPTIKHATTPTRPQRTHVITESDLNKWSNKPWTPIVEPSSGSSSTATISCWFLICSVSIIFPLNHQIHIRAGLVE